MPRNVLFITLDQFRADCLSVAGHPLVRTPNLDALCAEGVRFANHWTVTAPCGPARASLLTGMYAMGHRSVLNGTPLDDRFTTLPREVRKLGRMPRLFGYTDTSVDPRTVAADDPRLRTYEAAMAGFETDCEITENLPDWAEWLAAKGVDVPSDIWKLYEPADVAGADDHGESWAPTRFPAELSETAYLTERVLTWLRRAGDDFVAHVSYLRPHPPYRAPAPYHDLYSADDVPDPVRRATREAEAAAHPFLTFAQLVPEARVPDGEREIRQFIATYYGLIAEVDHWVGRLIAGMRELGVWDDTFVVLTSDHGEQAGDHWFRQKLGFFDQSYAIPLIVRDPSAEADATRGSVVEAFTESVDILPTILDHLGVEAMPPQCDGRTLLPFVRGETPEEWREFAFWEYDFRVPWIDAPLFGMRNDQCNLSVVRTGDAKYVHFAALDPLFFDLAADPGEFTNLAADPAYAGEVLAMAQRMLTHRQRHTDQTLADSVLTASGVVTKRDRLR